MNCGAPSSKIKAGLDAMLKSVKYLRENKKSLADC
jgi:hypothetical protein